MTTTKTTGTVAIAAHAGGQTASITATVSTAAARFAPFGHAGHGTTAGDRAAM